MKCLWNVFNPNLLSFMTEQKSLTCSKLVEFPTQIRVGNSTSLYIVK